MSRPQLPDVLVLGGGGVLGEAWMMGVLGGIEDAAKLDLRRCEYFVGTSAGAIVAAHLVAGHSPRRPDPVPDRSAPASEQQTKDLAEAADSAIRRAGRLAVASAAMFAPLALGAAAPGGALARALLLRRLPRPQATLDDLRRHVAESRARFDGRLRVAAVNRGNGRRVVFGSPRAPAATVADAVAASCTVPWLFAPVEIGGREYVDGGVWSPTNIDAAPAGRGAHVLCLHPTASLTGSDTIVSLLRTATRSAAAIESLAVRRRGASVRSVGPNADCAEAMGLNFMDRSRLKRVLEAGYHQGVAIGARGSIL